MVALDYVNIFAKDIHLLAKFYRDVFDLKDLPEVGSPIFRALGTGKSSIGFNAEEAFDLLGLEAGNTSNVRTMLTFEADDGAHLQSLFDRAVLAHATIIKAPYKTYYGSMQAVMKDPEGNVFRLNAHIPETDIRP